MAVDRRPRRPAPPSAAPRCHGRRRASALPWAGAALLAFGAALLLATLAAVPRQALALAAACAVALLLGREAAIPASLLLGGDPWLTAGLLLLLEGGALLLLTPRLAGTQPPLLVAAAARRRNAARRPTGLGQLYVRALVPFAFLGPLVALLMGEAAGLPPRRLLLTVAASCATALAAWTAFYAAALTLLGRHAIEAALAAA